MKKKICITMAIMLTLGTVSVSAAKKELQEITDRYEARVGTTHFSKNGELQPLDAEIYIKDGYVMLPLRTFMAALGIDNGMVWDNQLKTALVPLPQTELVFDISGNRILVDGKPMEVSGKMEIAQNRIFVPIRNWSRILKMIDETVIGAEPQWDEKTKTAVIHVKREIAAAAGNKEDSREIGEEPLFSLPLTNRYDALGNVGGGFFIAEKYMESGFGLGQGLISPDNEYTLIGSDGKIYQHFESNTIQSLSALGEGYYLIRSNDRAECDKVVDREGNLMFENPYTFIKPYSEGFARVEKDGFMGFVDREGRLINTEWFAFAEHFSEGFAAVCLEILPEQKTSRWGYIDTTGKLVFEGDYRNCGSFSDGIGKVITADGVGYIDRKGTMVIAPQYRWGSSFRNGTAFVQEEDTFDIWLIDKTGQKLKKIAAPDADTYIGEEEDCGIAVIEEVIQSPDGGHEHVRIYYDVNGELSALEYKIAIGMSEGLSPVYDVESKKYGYTDEHGRWIISPVFDQAEPFQDGYAVVANGIILENGEEDVEWGIIKHPARGKQ